jgi:hypothetical protein
VKRAKLLQTIGSAAQRAGGDWRLVRDRGDHEIWSLDGIQIVVPRHREVNEIIALRIFIKLEPRLGERWWRR